MELTKIILQLSSNTLLIYPSDKALHNSPPIMLTWQKFTEMSHLMTKPTKWHVRPAETQISLGNRPVWSESSLCTQWVAKVLSFFHADSEDSDQTGQMPRLIGVFTGHTCHFVGFVVRLLICFLWRTDENYPSIIIKYPPQLSFW